MVVFVGVSFRFPVGLPLAFRVRSSCLPCRWWWFLWRPSDCSLPPAPSYPFLPYLSGHRCQFRLQCRSRLPPPYVLLRGWWYDCGQRRCLVAQLAIRCPTYELLVPSGREVRQRCDVPHAGPLTGWLLCARGTCCGLSRRLLCARGPCCGLSRRSGRRWLPIPCTHPPRVPRVSPKGCGVP